MSKPNILLIVIDSLRSDKCISKNLSSITPNIDFLIKNGTAFPNTISSAAATAVAMSSIFTGLPPFKIGMDTINYHRLSPDIETYVKILKNNGYKVEGRIKNFFKFSHSKRVAKVIFGVTKREFVSHE